ncbi:MAG: cell division protein FtsZ [Gemmatimonadetes bacterium]|nr:cell division protein FtsZ [Gemmatimonadota bacterium]
MGFEMDDVVRTRARMRVVGVGGGGGSAVNRMVEEDLTSVEFVAVNTDSQALEKSRADVRIQIGKHLTRGLGAGARPEIGRQALAEDEEEVQAVLEGSDLVFIAAGMGGGTGTGAAPAIGRIARELNALSVAIVTTPFAWEGPARRRHAELGLADLRRHVDTMIVVPNDRLLEVVGSEASFSAALKKCDEVLQQATQGIADLIAEPGMVNVDFADVRTVMTDGGTALMGTGVAKGANRAEEAAIAAISSPLLNDLSIEGASGVLLNITGGPDLTMAEVAQINETVFQAAATGEVIFGVVEEPEASEEVRVTVIATGIHEPRRDRTADEPEVGLQRIGLSGDGGGSAVPAQSEPAEFADQGRVVIGSKYEGPRLFDETGEMALRRPRRAVAQHSGTDPAERAPRRAPAGVSAPEEEDFDVPAFIRRQMR